MKLYITQTTIDTILSAAKELELLIFEHNKVLRKNINCADLDEPDYHDYQTCQELQVIAHELKGL